MNRESKSQMVSTPIISARASNHNAMPIRTEAVG